MMRHHRDVEKDLRYGLLEPEPARFWRSSACFGSSLRTANATLLQRLPKQSNATVFRHRRPTTTYLQRLGSAVRCHVSERSATPPLSQRAASENGDGALPRGGIWSSSCARLPGTRDSTVAELDLPGRPTS